MSPDAAFVEWLIEQVKERVLEEQEDKTPVTKALLAKRYGVLPRTIKTWRQKGLPAHVVDGILMYVPEETDRWLRKYPDREGRL